MLFAIKIIVAILLLFWHYTIYVNKFTKLSLKENKLTRIKDRVVIIAERQEMSKEDFFKSIGMTSANFRGKARDTPLNSNAIANIISKYPDTDLYWLLSGYASLEIKDPKNIVSAPTPEFVKRCRSCEEKEKIIELLQQQITELKSDKVDLKKILGLFNKQ